MSHGVDERGSQLFALSRCLYLLGKILGSCPFQAYGYKIRDALQNGIGHPWTLNGETSDRIGAQPYRRQQVVRLDV